MVCLYQVTSDRQDAIVLPPLRGWKRLDFPQME